MQFLKHSSSLNLMPKSKVKTIDGIPMYAPSRYWGKSAQKELEQALSLIDENGWEEFKEQYKGKFDFTFEENRADWRFNIPVTKRFKVLDAGAGMGRISIPLSRVVEKVVAVDSSLERMKFLKKRAELEDIKNIEVMVGDIFDLPFPKESFDLIVMNGLLEWVGATEKFSDPRVAQVECLKICKDLLKPGGYLYIGIENRWAFSYLRGRDHSGLRFTSYMPRWFANLYMRMRKGRRYDTYTYGANGYKELLHEAGLSSPELYLVHPGYNYPRVTIPYENLGILRYVIQTLMPEATLKHSLAKLAVKSALLLRIYRKVFFSFNIIARK